MCTETNTSWFPLICVVVGSLISFLSTFIATNLNHKHNLTIFEKKQNTEAKAITNALIAELKALKIVFEKEFVPKICNSDRYLNYIYPLGTDYFSIFNSNASNIGKIKNDELRTCIINLYVTAKFFLDSIVTNNNVLNDYEQCYEEAHSISYKNADSYILSKVRENLNIAMERLKKSKEENLLPTCKRMLYLFETLDKIIEETK